MLTLTQRKKLALEKLRASKPTSLPAVAPTSATLPSAPIHQAFANIEFNTQQLKAVRYAKEFWQDSCKHLAFCLIGSAGTGKTTTVKKIVYETSYGMQQSFGNTTNLVLADKIILCAFTNRAVNNIRKAVKDLGYEFTRCCKTVHKALRYAPTSEEYIDEHGDIKERKVFRPRVTKESPDKEVQLIVIDEASMLGYFKLFREVVEGFPNAKFIFIGDLNQLQPVMDQPTLAYKLLDVPVVQLTHVYRQAMQSPIVRFQYEHTLSGAKVNKEILDKITATETDLKFFKMPWMFSDGAAMARICANKYFIPAIKAGKYNPDEDIILLPMVKPERFSTTELNKSIAGYLSDQRQADVYEVIAGYKKHYLAIGDKVLFARGEGPRECIITDISYNAAYSGDTPHAPSKHLDRDGNYIDGAERVIVEDAMDKFMESDWETSLGGDDDSDVQVISESEDRVTQASHKVILTDYETGVDYEATTAGEINTIVFAYALTVHKSQGSEWRKVYFILHHKHHGKMLNRELLYTGMTRASEQCVMLYSGVGKENSINKAIKCQQLKGLTWREKAKNLFSKLSPEDWRDGITSTTNFLIN